MENNKVYMKIKEIESREQRLIDSKKKIEGKWVDNWVINIESIHI
jgi:hypothetical protein